ncbi:hypothetical protein B0H17DRAFT_263860 [Mycena rosella]|uniref:Uncharacterized protein n=1 Tax=Mycena rosella TaxID=1033263 RepID=A0AAD7CX10_MYCRO|nr:hypothetical protein B0H17DRAFT_263860 [Mycena rosella]
MKKEGNSESPYPVLTRHFLLRSVFLGYSMSWSILTFHERPDHRLLSMRSSQFRIWDRSGTRQRLSYLPISDHERVAPFTSLAIRLICSNRGDLSRFQRLAKRRESTMFTTPSCTSNVGDYSLRRFEASARRDQETQVECGFSSRGAASKSGPGCYRNSGHYT